MESYAAYFGNYTFQSLGSVSSENQNPTIIPTTPPELSIDPSSTVTVPTTTPSTSGSLDGIPSWAMPYVNFVKDEIMPDISGDNYNLSSNLGLISKSIYNMCKWYRSNGGEWFYRYW